MEHLYRAVVAYRSASLLKSGSISNNPPPIMENRVNPFMLSDHPMISIPSLTPQSS